MNRSLGGVLLASGFSRRFGENKLLFSVDGAPLYRRAMDAVPAALFRAAAVVSQYAPILADAARLGYRSVPNSLAAEGLSASVRLGLSAVMPGVPGVLFAVCDQPHLTPQSVQKLLLTFAAHPTHIVCLAAEGARGNPVIFPQDLFPELLALTGDVGGSAVIKKHPHRLLTVEVPKSELADLDVK